LLNGRLAITGVEGKPGTHLKMRVRLDDPAAVQGVTVNGIDQKFTRTNACSG